MNEKDFYKDLEALSESAFPKKCANCGRVYDTSEDFIKKSHRLLNVSGLKGSIDDDNKPIVELFRNCVCGSTLMDFFSDRRDMSPKGLKRRELFGKLLDYISNKGYKKEARSELLKVMNGGESEILKKLGITFKDK